MSTQEEGVDDPTVGSGRQLLACGPHVAAPRSRLLTWNTGLQWTCNPLSGSMNGLL